MDPTKATQDLLKNLRRIRKEKGISQEVLADKLGISVNAYANMERGDTKITLIRLIEVSNILGIDISELLGIPVNKEEKRYSLTDLVDSGRLSWIESRLSEIEKILLEAGILKVSTDYKSEQDDSPSKEIEAEPKRKTSLKEYMEEKIDPHRTKATKGERAWEELREKLPLKDPNELNEEKKRLMDKFLKNFPILITGTVKEKRGGKKYKVDIQANALCLLFWCLFDNRLMKGVTAQADIANLLEQNFYFHFNHRKEENSGYYPLKQPQVKISKVKSFEGRTEAIKEELKEKLELDQEDLGEIKSTASGETIIPQLRKRYEAKKAFFGIIEEFFPDSLEDAKK